MSPLPAPPVPCPAATVPEEFAVLLAGLTEVADPRHARGRVPPLPGVPGRSVLGRMAGCRSLSASSRFGRIPAEVLAPLGLRRAPSVATLSRLLGRVAVADGRAARRTFVQRLLAGRGPTTTASVVALAGKPRHGVREDGEQPHVVQRFAHQGAVALDQVAAAPLWGEPAAARAWLGAVAETLPGLRVLTGDAISAEHDFCAALVADQRDDRVRLKNTS